MDHAMRLKDKTVFATAAGAGIGRAASLAMAREGASVYATDIDGQALEQLARESGNISTFVMDALDADAINSAVARVGPPDVLFNCTGHVHHGTILEATDADFDFSFQLNVKAHFRVARAFLPGMIDNGGGSIINMASVASSIKGTVNRCIYSATKGAVIGLTKAIAADFIDKGIRCNAVCPGSVDTPDDILATTRELKDTELLAILDRDLSKLGRLCDVVSRATQFPIPINYPVVGEDAFRTGTGVHAAAIIKAKRKGDDALADSVYSGVPASMVGREQQIGIGPMSGVSNVTYWLAKHDIPSSDDLVRAILAAAKESKALLSEEQVLAVIDRHQAPVTA